MRCPHCQVGVHFEPELYKTFLSHEYKNVNQGLLLKFGFCPECSHAIATLSKGEYRVIDGEGELINIESEDLIYPKFVNKIIAPEIPERYRNALNEASQVRAISAKASAALSRRLLQQILHEEYSIKDRSLANEIDRFLELSDIPEELRQSIDAVRNVGNNAAHPLKYPVSGEIVDVDPAECDWLIEILDLFFDVLFVQPKLRQQRKANLNQKLAALGKAPMKD